ncbi:MAG: hypothetical protein SNI54_01550 [Rikenellaceae bacterium]
MLGSLISLAIIAAIVLNWDWISDNIVFPLVKGVISLLHLFSMVLLIGVPTIFIIFFIFGRRVDRILRNGIGWDNWGDAIFAVVVGAILLAVLIFFIMTAFSDEGRLGYLKGVKRNLQRRASRTSSSSSRPTKKQSTDRECRYYSSGMCRHPESGGETCPCAGDHYFFTCRFKNRMY